MSDSSVLDSSADSSLGNSVKLPISSIVRAVCEAATAGPDLLYEVMIKMSLMVEATAPTYGLSIWGMAPGAIKPNLRWAEGLTEDEIATAQTKVAGAFENRMQRCSSNAGDAAICLVLALPFSSHEGSAIYGRCVRPLNAEQARELNALSDVAHLAHSHQLASGSVARVSAPGS
ncbi:MAG: hypothetical protein ABR555_16880, partial [Pyrinomonadaceae bacterium]